MTKPYLTVETVSITNEISLTTFLNGPGDWATILVWSAYSDLSGQGPGEPVSRDRIIHRRPAFTRR